MRKLFYVLPAFLFGCANGGSLGPYDAGSDDASDAGNDAIEETEVSDAFTIVDLDGGLDLMSPLSGPIVYLGGAAVVKPLTVNFIFYGSWTYSPTTAPLLQYLVANMGNTGWWKTTTHYYQQLPYTYDAGTNASDAGNSDDASDAAMQDAQVSLTPTGVREYVSGGMNLGQSIYVDYTRGKNINNQDVEFVIQQVITAGQVPTDPNAAYVFVAAQDVRFDDFSQGVFCFDFCAFHSHFQFNNTDFKYAYLGDPMQLCPDYCSLKGFYNVDYNVQISPNNDWVADTMANPLMHELHELTTDPDWDTNPGWQSQDQSYETGDACEWTFGPLFLTPNQSIGNIKVGDKYFMLQQIWDLTANNGSGACVMPK